MPEHDASDAAEARPLADMSDWLLANYREKLEASLAEAELPKLSQPREELQKQLAEVLAEQAERAGGADANP